MNAVLKDNRITAEEYLQGELASETKHEYIDGYIYAMAGASINHNRIASNIVGELRQHLKNLPCDVLTADFKVNINSRKFFYPDVVVICDHDNADEYYTETPILIVEVLSDSTQRKDRTLKRLSYQALWM